MTPLTATDLRDIAATLDKARRTFGEDGLIGFTKFGERFHQIKLEVLLTDADEVVGYISYQDGWLGFTPYGEQP